MARLFNGTSDLGQVAIDLSGTPRVSVSFWFWWDSAATNNKIVLEYGSDWGTNGGFLVITNFSSISGTPFGLGVSDITNREHGGFADPSIGTWHHFLVGYDRTQGAGAQLSAFFNGTRQTLSSSPASVQDVTGNFPNLTLNIMARAGGSLATGGRMSDLAIWDKQQPVAQDAAALASGRRANDRRLSCLPSYYWPMVGGSGAPAIGPKAVSWTGGTPTGDPTRLDPYRSTRGPVWAPGTLMAAALVGAVGGATPPPPPPPSGSVRYRDDYRTRYRW